MKHAWISAAALLAFIATTSHAQTPPAQSAMTRDEHHSTARSAQLTDSSEKAFDQLMDDAMSVMHQGMHGAVRSGDPDREFVNMMIPHHQGAIDMARALLLYGKDEQLKRLALEIIADQQNEIQLMQLWLSRHPAAGQAGK